MGVLNFKSQDAKGQATDISSKESVNGRMAYPLSLGRFSDYYHLGVKVEEGKPE